MPLQRPWNIQSFIHRKDKIYLQVFNHGRTRQHSSSGAAAWIHIRPRGQETWCTSSIFAQHFAVGAGLLHSNLNILLGKNAFWFGPELGGIETQKKKWGAILHILAQLTDGQSILYGLLIAMGWEVNHQIQICFDVWTDHQYNTNYFTSSMFLIFFFHFDKKIKSCLLNFWRSKLKLKSKPWNTTLLWWMYGPTIQYKLFYKQHVLIFFHLEKKINLVFWISGEGFFFRF